VREKNQIFYVNNILMQNQFRDKIMNKTIFRMKIVSELAKLLLFEVF